MSATTVQDPGRPARPTGETTALRRWLRRSRGSGSGDDLRRENLRRLDDVRAVLERARDTLATGWVQDRWYVIATRPSTGPAGLFRLTTIGPRDVTGACLVGAVALAVQQRDARSDLLTAIGPALDYVWDALQETRGLGEPGVAGRAAPPDVRIARIRDVVRWNDRPGRTRDEVLAVLDVAVSHSIMTAMRQPGPAAA